MTLLRAISRRVGAGDIMFGLAAFTYVDENGISHTMDEVNAIHVPYNGTQSVADIIALLLSCISLGAGGDVEVIGDLTVDGTALVAGNTTISGNIIVVGYVDTAGPYYIGGLQAVDSFGTAVRIASHLNWTELHLYTGGTPKLSIDSTGNVGIGTTTPNSKLAVTGLPSYVNNDAAKADGLVAGDFYRLLLDPANETESSCVCVVF